MRWVQETWYMHVLVLELFSSSVLCLHFKVCVYDQIIKFSARLFTEIWSGMNIYLSPETGDWPVRMRSVCYYSLYIKHWASNALISALLSVRYYQRMWMTIFRKYPFKKSTAWTSSRFVFGFWSQKYLKQWNLFSISSLSVAPPALTRPFLSANDIVYFLAT